MQKQVRDMILEAFDDLEEGDVRSTSMGASGVDILLSPKAEKYVPFQIECKNTEKVRLWESWDQAQANGTNPLLIVKKNRREPLAVLTVSSLFELLKELK